MLEAFAQNDGPTLRESEDEFSEENRTKRYQQQPSQTVALYKVGCQSQEQESEESEQSMEEDEEAEMNFTPHKEHNMVLCKSCQGLFNKTDRHAKCPACRRKIGGQKRDPLGRPNLPLANLTDAYKKRKINCLLEQAEHVVHQELQKQLASNEDVCLVEKLLQEDQGESSEIIDRMVKILELMKGTHEATLYLPQLIHELPKPSFQQMKQLLQNSYSEKYLAELKNRPEDEGYFEKKIAEHLDHPEHVIHSQRIPEQDVKEVQEWVLDKCSPIPGKTNSTIIMKDALGIKSEVAVHFRTVTLKELYNDWKREHPHQTHSQSWFISKM